MRPALITLFLLVFFSAPAQNRWVDSVFNTLTVQEKISQLFILTTPAHLSTSETAHLLRTVHTTHPGGVLFTAGGPRSVIQLTSKLQSESKVPLLLGAWAEYGAAQSLDSLHPFPKAMQLAATDNDSLFYRQGLYIGQQLKRLGLALNIGINIDPSVNQTSYIRYFSNDPTLVTRASGQVMRGMQAAGTIAVAFHPDPVEVSSADYPNQPISLVNLDTSFLRPLRRLSADGLDAVLTDQMNLRLNKGQKGLPPAANRVLMGDLLRQFSFKGLSMTNVPVLKNAMRKSRHGDAELLAFQLGNQLLISPTHYSAAVKKISRLVRKQQTFAAQLDQSVRQILLQKWKSGLHQQKTPALSNFSGDLNQPIYGYHNQAVAHGAVTVVRNVGGVIPIQELDRNRIVLIAVGQGDDREFVRYVTRYADVAVLSAATPAEFRQRLLQSADATRIIVGYFSSSAAYAGETMATLRELAADRSIVASFLHPGFLKQFAEFPVVLEGYTDRDDSPMAVAEVIFGGRGSTGKLPYRLDGITDVRTPSLDRLAFGVPEEVGMDSHRLDDIVAIAREAIDNGATPGCHVLVARKGKIIWDRSFGWHTYANDHPVTEETIYDLASVTKVSATLQAVMHLYDSGVIDINKKASVYLPELRNSNKRNFTLKDILTHQAGLWPFLPFWSQTMADSTYRPGYYGKTSSVEFPFPVAENLFANVHMKDSLWQWIIQARVRERAGRVPFDYRYSDMGFYILQHLSESLLRKPLEQYLDAHLYRPLGATTTGYLPLNRFSASRVAPTENDKLFRKSLLVGYVHDQGAAMHGGIAGHAGLFSTANDLAKLAQLWLQEGHYGGRQYYQPATLRLFTTRQYENSRRGLGWDKPAPGDWSTPTSVYSSMRTFGHTGFTGTCVWVDPEFELVYIFLSNRVHPDMTNNKILNANIRTRIHDVIYKSIFDYCRTHGETK